MWVARSRTRAPIPRIFLNVAMNTFLALWRGRGRAGWSDGLPQQVATHCNLRQLDAFGLTPLAAISHSNVSAAAKSGRALRQHRATAVSTKEEGRSPSPGCALENRLFAWGGGDGRCQEKQCMSVSGHITNARCLNAPFMRRSSCVRRILAMRSDVMGTGCTGRQDPTCGQAFITALRFPRAAFQVRANGLPFRRVRSEPQQGGLWRR